MHDPALLRKDLAFVVARLASRGQPQKLNLYVTGLDHA